jgi:phosphatidate cytidylyltransferase
MAVVLAFYGSPVFNAAIAVICVMAVLELLNATGTVQFRGFAAFALLPSLLLPFAGGAAFLGRLPELSFALFLLFFLLALKNHRALRFEQAAMVFFCGVFIPLCFSSAVYLRNQSGNVSGYYYLLVGLGCAWLCDTGAYFSGMLFEIGRASCRERVSKLV